MDNKLFKKILVGSLIGSIILTIIAVVFQFNFLAKLVLGVLIFWCLIGMMIQ